MPSKTDSMYHVCFFPYQAKTKNVILKCFSISWIFVLKENLELNITHLNLDFEYAAHEAARHFWPDVTIKGCQFHLAQAWYRKIQSLGLTSEYKDQESPVGQWLKTFFGLSFLDSEEVEERFVFDIFSEAPESEKAIKFTDYVVNNYISSDRSGRF